MYVTRGVTVFVCRVCHSWSYCLCLCMSLVELLSLLVCVTRGVSVMLAMYVTMYGVMFYALSPQVVSTPLSLLQAVDGVMSLALCPQVVSTPLSLPGDRRCDVLGFVPSGGKMSLALCPQVV